MNLRIDHYIHFEGTSDIVATLDRILLKLDQITQQEHLMSVQLDTLTQTVTDTKTVEDSAIVLLNGLSSQIAAIKDDPVKIQALSDELKAKSDELAAAVTANTPAA